MALMIRNPDGGLPPPPAARSPSQNMIVSCCMKHELDTEFNGMMNSEYPRWMII